MGPVKVNRLIRFGAFDVDLETREIRKNGLRLRLQEQPFQVLAALLEHPGELVTREDLVQRLWGNGTVVDFEQGLNAAIARLRQVLSDSAETPRYVQTVSRRGYRFIAAVETPAPPAIIPAPPAVVASPAAEIKPARTRIMALFAAVGVIALAASWWFGHRSIHGSEPLLRVVPLTTGAGIERNPSFSPDGSQIVYEWARAGEVASLYVKVVGAGDPIPLTSGASDRGPVWSPDGRQIAFVRDLDPSTVGVFVIPPFGGAERKVTEAARPSYWIMRRFFRRLDWTPDSRHVVVSVPKLRGGPEALLLLDVETGAKEWLTNPVAPVVGDREPAVSPDGRTVAFARNAAGAGERIFLLRLSSDFHTGGEPRQLAAAGFARSPAWTPDGSRILYTSTNPGMTFESGASLVRLGSEEAPRLLPELGINLAVPAISRTGRIAFARPLAHGHLVRQDIATRSGTVPPPLNLTESSFLDFGAQYSPDGQSIVFSSTRTGFREIWRCGSDGARCRALTAFESTFVISGSPTWSPDGKQIAFDSGAALGSDVYVVDANGGAVRRLTTDSLHGIVPSWSRDGKWIYFGSGAAGQENIWKMPSGGGTPVQVTRAGGLIAVESSDGTALYYTKTELNATLFRSALDGSAETAVLTGIARRGFVPAADRIYYLREQRDGSISLHRFLIATGEDVEVAPVSRSAYLGLSLSPDGNSLIYSEMNVTSNLMLAEGLR